MGRQTLQHFELHVLLAMLRERGETYSVPLVLALEQRTGRPVAQAAVFIALKRLERKGLVTSRLDEPDSGRARRYFSVTPDGLRGGRGASRSNTRGSGTASAGCSAPARRAGGMDWLLRLLVGEADRRAIDSDLSELHDFRRRRDGAAAADRWLRRQRRLYPWIVLLDHGRAALPGMDHHAASLARRPSIRSAAWRTVPALSATIVLTVGLGLGATVAFVALVKAVLVDPLPYADPGRLAWIYTDNPPYRFSLSVVDYRALERDHPAFSAIAAYQRQQVTVADGDAAERVSARTVTGSYFPLLGQKPHIGRLFDASDDARDDRIVVLTYGYWTRRFGRDPSVLGRAMTIDGARATDRRRAAAGVRSARTRRRAVLRRALADARRGKARSSRRCSARLRPGVSARQRQTRFGRPTRGCFRSGGPRTRTRRPRGACMDLKTRVVGEVGSTLVFVLAAVAACCSSPAPTRSTC